MKFFQDVAEVSFAGLDKVFNVSSVFCEFSLGGNDISIKWYGVIIAFGFTLAVLFGGRMAYKWKMDLNKMIDVLIYGTFAAIIGARLYYCIFNWSVYADDPIRILYIWEGGLAIYGGIIGGVLAAFIVCKVEKLNFYNLIDLIGMSLLIGQGIGRWGNYANQEAFGCNTDGATGMMSEKVTQYILRHQAELPGVDPYAPVHPTFFYESVWCIVGFLLLFLMCKKFRKFSGQIFLSYGIWYGIGRMIIEGLRTDSLYIDNTNIRVSQLLSAAIVIVCAAIMIVMIIKHIKNPKPVEGVDYFIEPVPFLKKNRIKFEEEQKAKEEAAKTDSEEKEDVHKD
ncbi:MAG: prolipoprotein diacylglyceryl transferase [Clostridia bacterium]|nr:prolipoprotein diacylglyceryl transferase [Clostridia bacterium]